MGKRRWKFYQECVICANGEKRSLQSLKGLTRNKIAEITGIPVPSVPMFDKMFRPKSARGRFYKKPPKDPVKQAAWIKNHPAWAVRAGLISEEKP